MTNQCALGHDNTPGSVFCSTCGTSLAREEQTWPPAAASPSSWSTAGRVDQVPAASVADGEGDPAAGSAGGYLANRADVPAANVGTRKDASTKRNALIAGGVGLLLLILVVGGIVSSLLGDDSSTGAAKSGKTLRGIAVLFDTDGAVEGTWDDCEGTTGFDDFSAGMSLKITGTNDEIVGSGDVVNVTEENIDDVAQAELDGDHALGLSATTHDDAVDELRDMLQTSEDFSCMLYFEADIEPADFYSVELGSRGGLNFSKADLEETGYVVGYTLGDL